MVLIKNRDVVEVRAQGCQAETIAHPRIGVSPSGDGQGEGHAESERPEGGLKAVRHVDKVGYRLDAKSTPRQAILLDPERGSCWWVGNAGV